MCNHTDLVGSCLSSDCPARCGQRATGGGMGASGKVCASSQVQRRSHCELPTTRGRRWCGGREGQKCSCRGELWASLPSPQRVAILRHELAHYRRGDLWKGALIRLLALRTGSIRWPGGSSGIWRSAPNGSATTQRAAPITRAATEYAEVLLRLGQQPRNLGVWATAMRGGRLHRRICHVLSPAPKEKSIMKKSLLVAIPLVLLAGHLIRVELVAKAQGTDVAASATESTTIIAPGQSRVRNPHTWELPTPRAV